MEVILNKVSKKIVDFIYRKNNDSEIKQLELLYGIQILLYNFSILTLIIIFSLIAGTFKETMAMLIIFGILRNAAGGLHFNRMEKCVAATAFIIIGGSFFAKYIQINFSVCIFLCILINIIFFTYTPIGTKDKPITLEYSRKQKKLLHILSLFFSALALLASNPLREVILISMCLEILTLLPSYFHKFPDIV